MSAECLVCGHDLSPEGIGLAPCGWCKKTADVEAIKREQDEAEREAAMFQRERDQARLKEDCAKTRAEKAERERDEAKALLFSSVPGVERRQIADVLEITREYVEPGSPIRERIDSLLQRLRGKEQDG